MMAKFSVQHLISKDVLEFEPEVRDAVKANMLKSLMIAVQAGAMFGEVIVNIQPEQEQPESMEMVRLKQVVQISPLVRCRDCKHRIVNEHFGEKGYMRLKAKCELDTGDPFELGRCAEDDDWFCADGERKNEEQDGDGE